jgi:hypothetical protein
MDARCCKEEIDNKENQFWGVKPLKYIMPGTERLTARTVRNSRLFSNNLVGTPFSVFRDYFSGPIP